MKYVTKSFRQTQKLGEKLAGIVVKNRRSSKFCYDGATVILLYGDLGGGKTTFLQGFAKGLGVKEKILSPTFVIMKKFSVPSLRGVPTTVVDDEAIQSDSTNSRLPRSPFGLARNDRVLNFYHIDAYRLQNEKDAKELGLPEILKNPENIVAIEWPERIKKILFTRRSLGEGGPKIIKINFKFISKNERSVDIEL